MRAGTERGQVIRGEGGARELLLRAEQAAQFPDPVKQERRGVLSRRTTSIAVAVA